MRDDPKTRIARPRQVYTGETKRHYVPLELRTQVEESSVVRERELIPV